MMRTILSVVILLCSHLAIQAQDFQPSSGYVTAKAFRVTRPLRELNGLPEKTNGKEKLRESGDRKTRQPQYFEYTGADGAPYSNDESTIQKEMGQSRDAQLRANFAGQSSGGSRPFDPSGAAGPNHYVQMINATTFRVYNKETGATMGAAQSLGTLWNPDTQNNGDPIVLYDKAADRWFLAQFGSFFNNEIYIAISTTGDPLGSYYTYTFESPAFPDYLKFSVWQDGYYMTANTNTQRVFAFERDAMLAGTPGARSVFTSYNPPDGGGFFVPVTGCAADGVLPPAGTPCPIFSYSDNGWGGGNQDRVNIYNMTVNWATNTPTATITSANNVNTAAFDGSYNSNWDDVSQPGTTQKLDGIGGICMYRGQWKTWEGYNSVVLNWAVKISNSQRSIKWCELRQDQNTGTWSMYQEGIYTPDSDTRWMGSIIMDDNGSIGLSYMKANTTTSIFPGLYFTGRRACDPLGELPITEVIVVEGAGSQTGTNRNGDYAHGCLDPDGVTIWSTSEYMGGQTGFSAARTRIFSYQIEPCIAAAVSIELVGSANPICANEAITLTATPAYGGDSPQYEWYINGNPLNLNQDNALIVTPQNGDIITCTMISNEPGLEGVMVTSNEGVLEIATSLEPQVSVTSAQEVICEGEEAVFVANGSHLGNTPTYQWFVDGTAVGTDNDSLVYAFTSAQNVTCTATSSLSCASPAEVVSAAFSVTPQAEITPEITIVATSETITDGQSVTFTATATNAGSNPTYQWYINGLVLSGATASTYTTSTIGNGQTITCRIVGTVPCSSVQTVTSNSITITVLPNAVFEWENDAEMIIYPNPSQGEVTFKSKHAGTFYMVNEAGQLVREISLNNSNNFELKLTNLASGSYIVAGQNDFGIVKEKLIIAK
ncbi:MAG: T9SS type A sorting domain-containing protein [Flavobacteriales bacterium]